MISSNEFKSQNQLYLTSYQDDDDIFGLGSDSDDDEDDDILDGMIFY